MGINLTHVVRRFIPQEWGGIETFVVNASRKLENRGFRNKVFTTNSMSDQVHENIAGLEVHRFSYFYPYLGLSGDRWAAFDRKGGNSLSFSMFFALLKDPSVDAVQLFAMGRLGAMVATACKWKGIPYIVNMQGGFPAKVPAAELAKFQEPLKGTLDWGKPFGALFGSRKLMGNADALVCAGGQDYEYAKQAYPHKRVYYVPCCVDTEYFATGHPEAFKKKYGLEDKRILLNIGRIDTQKNQKLIVSALPQLLQRWDDLVLVLIGSVTVRSYYEELKELIAKQGLESKVLIIEGLEPDSSDLLNAYASCEVFILSSIQECGATVVLEAMSAGKPVAASNAGGLPWIIEDGTDGLLFETNDADGLGKQVARLLEDRELYDRIRHAGTETARRRFDWAVVADQLADICNEVIAAKGGVVNEDR